MVPLDELQDARKRPRALRVAVAILPAVAFLGLLWFGLARSGPQATVGGEAPEFKLPKLDGGTLSSEDLKGSPVLVNFWASWCVPCREEAPLLERTWKRYRDEGVIFLGVNIKDAKDDAKKFVDDFGITFPQVRDIRQELTRDFGVTGIPETFFIDHNWTFIGNAKGSEQGQQSGLVILGAITEEQLVSNIEILLARAGSE